MTARHGHPVARKQAQVGLGLVRRSQGAADGDIPAALLRVEPARVLHAARVTANGWLV